MVAGHPFRILNRSGDPVRGDLRYIEDNRLKPLVLICHGFNTNKDWGPFPYCGETLAEAGFATILFNFSHNGVGEDSSHFTEYGAFSLNTPGKELEDIQAILDGVTDQIIGKGCIDRSRIGMAGHSRGAGMSILTAVSDDRIRAVVSWSTVSAFLRFTSWERRKWIENGYHPLRYGAMRTMLRYDVSVLEDLERNAGRYDLELAARELRIPTLFIHGDNDAIVPQSETVHLFNQTESPVRRLEIVTGADHTYGTAHPFSGSTPGLDQMLELTQSWFQQFLTEENS